jgi:hypothetical protein
MRVVANQKNFLAHTQNSVDIRSSLQSSSRVLSLGLLLTLPLFA